MNDREDNKTVSVLLRWGTVQKNNRVKC